MNNIQIYKRNGSQEPLDLNKIHKVLGWACENITGVSISEIELKSQLKFYNGMKSKDIHRTLIKTSADLISDDYPNYQYVAARLLIFDLRKDLFNNINPPHIKEIVRKNVEQGMYTHELLEWYTDEEWDYMQRIIKHDRDYQFSYAGMAQWIGKYLVQNRVTGEIFESPQIAYMLIAATLFHSYPKNERMRWVRKYYDAISNFDISLPTPVLAGVRTKTKQFSSCVGISCGDSLASINATASSIVNYASKKAGIGLNIGRIRALGSEIGDGSVRHTGIIPFLKYFVAALKSCHQGGIRGSSATAYYPFFHYEFENLIVLKNNKGTEENRVRHLDYGVQLNRLAYQRLINQEYLTLFSPHEVPDLMEAFYAGDNDEFERLYVKYERSSKIKMKKKIKAFDLFNQVIDERVNTGRIYIQNIDHCNNQSAFDSYKHPIEQSNLCAEINLPSKPFESLGDDNGEIFLCTLSAINWGNIKQPDDFKRVCELAVRSLDAILDYQDFPAIQAKKATEHFRTLGVGITNFAYWLAKNGHQYDDGALEKVHEFMEAQAYYLTRASVDLAKEKGPCKLWDETEYSQGHFPFDNRKKNIDDLVKHELNYDWDSLREDVKEYGIRNATLMAQMPVESSSVVMSATNGIEPPRALVSEKISKAGVVKVVVPGHHHLKNKYQLLWNMESPENYLKICAVIQKFMDQAISVNTSYNPRFFKDEMVPLSRLIQDLIMFYKYGGKNLYYNNINDGATDEDHSKTENETDASDHKSDIDTDEEDCEACSL